jgi:hypothetical protein
MESRCRMIELEDIAIFLGMKRVGRISTEDFSRMVDAIRKNFPDVHIDTTRNGYYSDYFVLDTYESNFLIRREMIDTRSCRIVLRTLAESGPGVFDFLMKTFEDLCRDEKSSIQKAWQAERECREKIDAVLSEYRFAIKGDYELCAK